MFRILAFLWVLLVAAMSLTGTPPVISVSVLGWDKFQHGGAYAVMTLLAIRALRVDRQHERSAVIISIMLSASLGALMEVLQGIMHNGREADLLDALANSVGALVAGGLYWFWYRQASRCELTVVFVLAGSLLIQAMPASAQDLLLNRVASDTETFLGDLPAAATRMATFPVNQSAGGPWWALTTLGVAGTTFTYDRDIREQMQENRSSTLDHAADFGSLVGHPLMHVGLVSCVYAGGVIMERDGWRQAALRSAEALFLADAVTLVAKEAIGRARPDTGANTDRFQPFRFNGRNDSLPSLHTASSFALATVLAHESDSWLVAAGSYVTATWVGVSRVIQDHHWASDVVVGAAIGTLSGWSVLQEKAKVDRQQLTVLPLAMAHGAGLVLAGSWQ